MKYIVTKNKNTISADKSKIEIDYVHNFLSNSYWSPGVARNVVKKAMKGSLCFGVYNNNKQVGYAKMITDKQLLPIWPMFL